MSDESMPDDGTTLRRATPADAAEVARIHSHPAVQPNLMQLPYANVERARQMLVDNEQPGRSDFVLVAEQQGRLLGLAGLHPIDRALRRRHAAMLGIAVDGPAQGRGLGRRLVAALCDYADQWGQVLRIELTVFADNERAIRLYRSMGFVQEGLHRGYALRQGRYVDALSMARLHPAPPAIASAGHRRRLRSQAAGGAVSAPRS